MSKDWVVIGKNGKVQKTKEDVPLRLVEVSKSKKDAKCERKHLRREQRAWRAKYDPRTLRLGMVSSDCFPDYNDEELFRLIRENVEQFEFHVGERLPEDFRKYLLHSGTLFYNWSLMQH
jgi:hypothetical protein